jgi:cardiolipin synthase A/B
VKLFIQPESGIQPLLEAIGKAKKSVQILIFRIDRSEIEKALVDAVQRGVSVHALIAYTNRGGDKNLRRFEMRLLERGITVARTADDLVRYHGKMFIIDEHELYLLAFNYTHLDINLSRSFAVSTTNEELVTEAKRLFECDVKRVPYTAGSHNFVVSPINAREELVKFIKGAKKQLLMYEMKISDREFVSLLTEKISEGVDVRVIGRTATKARAIPTRSLPIRLHARAILRDGNAAFLGSQSLRKLEMEARREVGIIFSETKIVKEMIEVFDKDWMEAEPAVSSDSITEVLDVPAKKVAKAVAKQISVRPVVEQLLDKVLDKRPDIPFEPDEVVETVREAFREEVHDAVVNALQELVGGGHAEDEGVSEISTNGNGSHSKKHTPAKKQAVHKG